MSEVIVVTSGKGGVGKTTTTANVGTGLAAAGKKVALIDTDIGLRNLDVVMGLENRIVYNLAVAVGHLLHLLLQGGVLQLGGRVLALGHQEHGVAQGVVYIEKFFRCHT